MKFTVEEFPLVWVCLECDNPFDEEKDDLIFEHPAYPSEYVCEDCYAEVKRKILTCEECGHTTEPDDDDTSFCSLCGSRGLKVLHEIDKEDYGVSEDEPWWYNCMNPVCEFKGQIFANWTGHCYKCNSPKVATCRISELHDLWKERRNKEDQLFPPVIS
jgi:Zn finger protein HypA/HybF involved in hydrogenase expression